MTVGQTREKGEKISEELMGWTRVFETIKGKTKEGSEIWMRPKILEGVAAATTRLLTSYQYEPII